ncbi:MAG: 6,7-dimethyl-8-ribityllumazine synthase [Planctomycetota bacterium]|jgi:6,7-dimethyl-8-ribityllumazine synthase
MPEHLEPKPLDPAALRFAIVVSRFNKPVTSKLLEGALTACREHGIPDDNLTVAWVPGAFELPLACRELAQKGDYDAIIALGAVIRGETSHYDYVCSEAASGLMRVGLDQALPVIFGVLTTDNADQALARAGGAKANKGADAVAAAMQMCGLLRAARGDAAD